MNFWQVYYHHYLRVLHCHMQSYRVTLHVTLTFLNHLGYIGRRKKNRKVYESDMQPAAGEVVLAKKEGWTLAAVIAVTVPLAAVILVLVQPS